MFKAKAYTLGRRTPWTGVHPGEVYTVDRGTPWAGVHPGQGYTLGRRTPWAGVHPGQAYTLGRGTRWAGVRPGQGYALDRRTPWTGVPPGQAYTLDSANLSPNHLEQPTCSVSKDIDALLEELLETDCSDALQSKTEEFPKGSPLEKKFSFQTGQRKCCPAFVGGSSVTNGVGTATSKRSCDQLRCISCDFRVLMFDDCEWDPSCDYLFFRNNMPNCQKLRTKLKRRRGYRGYACQCSWFSASEPADLRDQPQLRWVCGKHQD
ncbi:cilia- and flagella-associated protein 418 [Xenentodon cancila]